MKQLGFLKKVFTQLKWRLMLLHVGLCFLVATWIAWRISYIYFVVLVNSSTFSFFKPTKVLGYAYPL